MQRAPVSVAQAALWGDPGFPQQAVRRGWHCQPALGRLAAPVAPGLSPRAAFEGHVPAPGLPAESGQSGGQFQGRPSEVWSQWQSQHHGQQSGEQHAHQPAGQTEVFQVRGRAPSSLPTSAPAPLGVRPSPAQDACTSRPCTVWATPGPPSASADWTQRHSWPSLLGVCLAPLWPKKCPLGAPDGGSSPPAPPRPSAWARSPLQGKGETGNTCGDSRLTGPKAPSRGPPPPPAPAPPHQRRQHSSPRPKTQMSLRASRVAVSFQIS